MKTKYKFYIGLLLIVIGIITNFVYYYLHSQGNMVTGYLGIFIMASASPIPFFIYFVGGGLLMYRYRPSRWINQKEEK